MRWQKFFLVIYKIVRLFVNPLTSNDKLYLVNRDNLTQSIEMQLSQKQKNFGELFFAIVKSTLNFETFAKKDDRHS